MQITRTELSTGTKNRTERDKIEPLFVNQTHVESEQYGDASSSEGWTWDSDPTVRTWTIQLAAMKVLVEPFAILDGKGDGVFTYFFNHQYLPIEGDGEEDDLSPANFDEKIAKLMRRYPQYFQSGFPIAGRTSVMSAVRAADQRFLREFPDPANRFDRARILWSDGALEDISEFRSYLSAAGPDDNDQLLGVHGTGDNVWKEKWAIAVLGEKDGGGVDAFKQFQIVASDHPWVHPVYFEGVTNPAEIGEDMAFMTVPPKA